MSTLASFLAATMIGAYAVSGGAGPANVDKTATFPDEQVAVVYNGIAKSAAGDCRVELAGDAFANFRMATCVNAKVDTKITEINAPQLLEYARTHPASLILAAR